MKIVLASLMVAMVTAFECPGDGWFRNPDDCNRYWVCDQTGVFDMPCPTDPILYFNEAKGQCDWPENVPECEFVCPGDGMFLDKLDCNKYWWCVGDQKHHMPCPDGLWFNEGAQVCDWPENVPECPLDPPTPAPTDAPTTPEPTTPEPTTPEPTTPIPTTPEPSTPEPTTPEPTTPEPTTPEHTTPEPTTPEPTTPEPTTPEPTTPEPTTPEPTTIVQPTTQGPTENPLDCKKDGRFLDKQDCNRFYRCFNGRLFHLTCPDNPELWFNEGEQVCDWPENVPECPFDPPTRAPTTAVPTTVEPTTGAGPTTAGPTTAAPTEPPTDDCEDTWEDCASMPALCKEDELAVTYCPKTCGRCNDIP